MIPSKRKLTRQVYINVSNQLHGSCRIKSIYKII